MKNYRFSISMERMFLMTDAESLSPDRFREMYPWYTPEREKDVLVLGTIHEYEIQLATYFPKFYMKNAMSKGYSQINIVDTVTSRVINSYYINASGVRDDSNSPYLFVGSNNKNFAFKVGVHKKTDPPYRKLWNRLLEIFC